MWNLLIQILIVVLIGGVLIQLFNTLPFLEAWMKSIATFVILLIVLISLIHIAQRAAPHLFRF